jgi:hypothetical protein
LRDADKVANPSSGADAPLTPSDFVRHAHWGRGCPPDRAIINN